MDRFPVGRTVKDPRFLSAFPKRMGTWICDNVIGGTACADPDGGTACLFELCAQSLADRTYPAVTGVFLSGA